MLRHDILLLDRAVILYGEYQGIIRHLEGILQAGLNYILEEYL